MNDTILLYSCLAVPAVVVLSLVTNQAMLQAVNATINQRAPQVKHRWSSINKPCLGGFGFAFCMLLGLMFMVSMFPDEFLGQVMRFSGMLLGLLTAFLLGYIDDRRQQGVWVKLFGQFLSAALIVGSGSVIEISSFGSFNVVFSVLWIVGLMNSINMLDNMDAVTTSACIGILVGLGLSQYLVGGLGVDFLMTAVMVGALVGFLVFNWHPSKMFMGDAGSLLLGAFLGYLSIHYAWNAQAHVPGLGAWGQLGMVGVLFVVPLSDTLTVSINRLRRGVPPWVGGRDHTTHFLCYNGMAERKVGLLYLCISCACVFPFLVPLLFAESWQAWQGIVLWGVVIGVFAFLYSFTLEEKVQDSPEPLKEL